MVHAWIWSMYVVYMNCSAYDYYSTQCIQTYLDSPEDSLLQWSPSDTLPGKQAHLLGAPLVEGNNLYIDLQRTYQNQLLAETQSNNNT